MFRLMPPSRPCRYCHGKAKNNGYPEGEHECTSCNGTGMDGEPAYLVIYLLLFVAAVVIGTILAFT